MTGRWFEDLEPGLVVAHAATRTITQDDNAAFCELTMNEQPLHLDEDFARTTEFGRIIVNSLYTLGLVVGMTVPELTLETTVANLGFGSIEFPAPVFPGDRLRAQSEVIATRASRSRPRAGVVEFEHRGRNQDGTLVVRARRHALMHRRPA